MNTETSSGAKGPRTGETTTVVLEKEMVKEALAELLGEFLAFRALMKGKGPARTGGEVAAPTPPRSSNSGPAEAGRNSEPPPPPRGRGGEERSDASRNGKHWIKKAYNRGASLHFHEEVVHRG